MGKDMEKIAFSVRKRRLYIAIGFHTKGCTKVMQPVAEVRPACM